jgi:hypothetical protein
LKEEEAKYAELESHLDHVTKSLNECELWKASYEQVNASGVYLVLRTQDSHYECRYRASLSHDLLRRVTECEMLCAIRRNCR